MCGQPCDLEGIRELSRRYGFHVIEDASHAIGARYEGQPIGDCRFSDITVFSFHPVKIITTAEGGAALTNNAAFAERMALYRNHGITRDPAQMKSLPDGAWYYEQITLGFNYRMTDLQAALGLSQLNRVEIYVARRHELASYYDRMLAELPIVCPWQDVRSYSSFHLYVVRLRLNSVARSHREVFELTAEARDQR